MYHLVRWSNRFPLVQVLWLWPLGDRGFSHQVISQISTICKTIINLWGSTGKHLHRSRHQLDCVVFYEIFFSSRRTIKNLKPAVYALHALRVFTSPAVYEKISSQSRSSSVVERNGIIQRQHASRNLQKFHSEEHWNLLKKSNKHLALRNLIRRNYFSPANIRDKRQIQSISQLMSPNATHIEYIRS